MAYRGPIARFLPQVASFFSALPRNRYLSAGEIDALSPEQVEGASALFFYSGATAERAGGILHSLQRRVSFELIREERGTSLVLPSLQALTDLFFPGLCLSGSREDVYVFGSDSNALSWTDSVPGTNVSLALLWLFFQDRLQSDFPPVKEAPSNPVGLYRYLSRRARVEEAYGQLLGSSFVFLGNRPLESVGPFLVISASPLEIDPVPVPCDLVESYVTVTYWGGKKVSGLLSGGELISAFGQYPLLWGAVTGVERLPLREPEREDPSDYFGEKILLVLLVSTDSGPRVERAHFLLEGEDDEDNLVVQSGGTTLLIPWDAVL